MKKILTVFALFVMLSLLGTAVLAAGGKLDLKCEDVTVDLAKDSTFEVKVSSTGTPAYTTGIVDVEFDDAVFKLTKIVFNPDLAPNNATWLEEDEKVALSASTYFAGSSEGTPVPSADGVFTVSFGDDLKEENYTEAGLLFTLTFKVIGDNASGPYTIGLKEVESSYLDTDMNPVTVSLEDGSVSAEEKTLPGDVNEDGNVNGLDLVRLRKYLNGWNVTINVKNSNVNGDSTVNGLDLVRLRKWLNGWNVELK